MQLIITDGHRCGKRGYLRDRIELCALQLEYGADTSDCIVEREPLLGKSSREVAEVGVFEIVELWGISIGGG
jgi:hypothetical protein